MAANDAGFVWTFLQLGGDQKTLVLQGYLAPFGRPRQKAIIKETIKSRIQTTYYPGSKGPPTRHVFGTNWEPMELTGRWMTKSLAESGATGLGSANNIATAWTDFLQDEQPIRMSWGMIISYTVFIEELELGRESEHEIAWRMKLLVDKRDDIGTKKFVQPKTPISDDMTEINTFLATSQLLQAPAVPDMSFDLFDSLNALAGRLNQFQAQMNKFAGELGDIESSTFSTIQHFRGAIAGFRNAVEDIRDLTTDVRLDSGALADDLQDSTFITQAFISRSAESDIRWSQYQAEVDRQTIYLQDRLAEIDLKASLLVTADALAFILAIQGDTWESLSKRAVGDISKAAKMRSINGARYGEQPEPGQSYLVPA